MRPGGREPSTNLDDLRARQARSLALLLAAGSAILLYFALPMEPYPWQACALLLGLALLSLIASALADRNRRFASHLLVWGATAALLAAMALFAAPWLPFLGPVVVLVASLLPGAELAAAGAVEVLALALNLAGRRAYPLLPLGATLALSAAATWAAMGILYTALAWLWETQQRASRMLEVARDRQAQLNSTLKSLDLAYNLQRRTQDELMVARQQADEARRLKERFAANISHELRTPLCCGSSSWASPGS